MSDRLERYRSKRDAARTREPGVRGQTGRRRAKGKAPRFVIQKHAASSLHYDFRLEVDGTLQRTRGGSKPQRLMIKRRDGGADARRNPESAQPESVKSGRTVEQVGQEEDDE